MKKLVIALAALALPLVAAQKFNLRVFQPARLSGTELRPGDYRLELTDNRVVLKSGKTAIEATATVQSGDQKFSATTLKINQGAIEEIRLGGTNTTLIFNR
jgi:hypothetical protein